MLRVLSGKGALMSLESYGIKNQGAEESLRELKKKGTCCSSKSGA